MVFDMLLLLFMSLSVFFDFEEYVIRKESGITVDFVFDKMHDKEPKSGAVLFEEGNRHIILMHTHDETEEMVPQYYKLFLDHCLENGLIFDAPKLFIEI